MERLPKFPWRGALQLAACLNKHSIEKRRNIRVSICECCSHLLLIVILVFGYNLSRVLHYTAKDYSQIELAIPPDFLSVQVAESGVGVPKVEPFAALNLGEKYLISPWKVPSLNSYLQVSQFVSPFFKAFGNSPLASTSLYQSIGNIVHPGAMHFAPAGPQVSSLLSYMNSSGSAFASTPVYVHDSEADAIDYILNNLNERAFALVVLHQITPLKVNYEIRLNYSTLPNTNRIINNAQLGLSTSFENYLLSGFLSVQQAIDNWAWHYTGAIQPHSPICSSKPEAFFMPFPTPAYNANPFYTRVGFLLGLAMTMATLYPMSRLVKSVVEEKETRIREIMKIMGLSDWAHQLSWFLMGFVLFLWIAISTTYICNRTFLTKTNPIILFAFFFLFCMSEITFSLMISVFFSNSKLAAIAAPVLLFAAILPRYVFFTTNSDEQYKEKYAASILSPTAFTFGADALATYEYSGQGIQFSNIEDGLFSFGGCLRMMFLDFFVYGFLALYFDQVVPQEFGTPRHWLFFLSLRYWWPAREANVYQPLEDTEDLPELAPPSSTPENMRNVEPIAPEMRDAACVRIQNLRKRYPDGKLAVKGLSLAMLEGQITCLLGANGAGKTTTISILTGLIEATAGEVSIYGKRLSKHLPLIRQMTGICPQHNVLCPTLTVMEHLLLFGRIKGLYGATLRQAADAMIEEVGLTEKRNAAAASLSGGMKRKLSLALALIGDPLFVLLDEPTSGMDPYSRRSTWELLQRAKAGRVVVLTTHFMDEADTLGDRIAIMSEGKLRCSGSSLFLKSRFGAGYLLSMAKSSAACHVPDVEALVTSVIHSATVSSVVAGEIVFQLPINAVPLFAALFEVLKEKAASLNIPAIRRLL